MKRILTLLLVAVMLVSTLAITAGAKGTLIFSDNFDMGFMPRNWITDRESCHFEWDKTGGDNRTGAVKGYSDSVVLQSNFGTKNNRWWNEGYMAIDFRINDFDDLPGEERESHGVMLWMRDNMENAENEGAVYTFNIEIETGKAELRKSHSWKYYDDAGVAQEAKTEVLLAEGNINAEIEVGNDAPFYEIGWRITSGKIECYFEKQLVISAEADPSDPKLGDYTLNSVDTSVGTQKTAFLFWNHGNWITVDNFEVWSADYDFATVTYGDVDNSGAVDLGDVTKMLQAIAKWDLADYNEAAADVDASGAVDLGDVTHMLKYIAKWEGITLG